VTKAEQTATGQQIIGQGGYVLGVGRVLSKVQMVITDKNNAQNTWTTTGVPGANQSWSCIGPTNGMGGAVNLPAGTYIVTAIITTVDGMGLNGVSTPSPAGTGVTVTIVAQQGGGNGNG
jgi:hypothetical protein